MTSYVCIFIVFLFFVYVSWFSTKSASLPPTEGSGFWNIPVLHPTLPRELLQFTGQPVWGGGAVPAPSRAPTPPHSTAGWVCLSGLQSPSKIHLYHLVQHPHLHIIMCVLNRNSAIRSVRGRGKWITQEANWDQSKGLPRSCSPWVSYYRYGFVWYNCAYEKVVICADFEVDFHFHSDTTRPPKCHEESGREYHFISREQFDTMVCNHRWSKYTQLCINR